MAKCATVKLPGALESAAIVPARDGAATAPARTGSPRSGGGEAARARTLEMQLEDRRRQLDEQRARLEQATGALAEAARQLRQLQQDMLAEAEGQLLDLAVQIARKVLGQEIQAGRYEIEPIVAEALRRLTTRRNVVVHLNPDDYAQCQAARCEEGRSQDVKFVADPNVRRAACRVETPEGVVESAVESQLAEIAEALRKPE